jgi:hypothetical protein
MSAIVNWLTEANAIATQLDGFIRVRANLGVRCTAKGFVIGMD